MAEHIEGPLYYERMGRTGPVIVFVHPNPMDQSCWIYQLAHFSTWYRCIAIDIPGYGRSPKATRGLTMDDMAQACWEAVDEALPGELAQILPTPAHFAVAQQVLASNEAHQRRINALYNRYLHHPASGPVPGGSLDQVAASIIGSEEYCRR